jgi:hypothetical protein
MDKTLLQNAIHGSTSIAEVLEKLGLQAQTGGNYKTFHKYVRLYELDVSALQQAARHKGSYISNLDSVLIKGSGYNKGTLKRRLIKEQLLPYACAVCQISDWQGKHLSLQLDHINGVNNDDRLENLRLLCPNCHSQTATYSGRNRKRSPQNKCIDCGTNVGRLAARCKSCAGLVIAGKTKIKWPTNEQLLHALETKSYLALSRELGISDNAIRKRLKR